MNKYVAASLLLIAMPIVGMERNEIEVLKRKRQELRNNIRNYQFPLSAEEKKQATENLFTAIQNHKVDHAAIEIELYGADVNAELQTKTPLILAINIQSHSMVKMLVEKGANPDQKTSLGCSAKQYVKNLRDMQPGNVYGLGNTNLRDIAFTLNRDHNIG
jgi:ankyrin repeat protein